MIVPEVLAGPGSGGAVGAVLSRKGKNIRRRQDSNLRSITLVDLSSVMDVPIEFESTPYVCTEELSDDEV